MTTLYRMNDYTHPPEVEAVGGWQETERTYRRREFGGWRVVRKDAIDKPREFGEWYSTEAAARVARLRYLRRSIASRLITLHRDEHDLADLEAAWPAEAADPDSNP